MSFGVEPAAKPARGPAPSSGAASVEGTVKGGRSPAKRTVIGYETLIRSKAWGWVRFFTASSRARPAARTSPPSGAGKGRGRPKG